MTRQNRGFRCLSCVAAWVQAGWRTWQLASRRSQWWRTRAMIALVFAVVGAWAAVAPQGALSLGERLRLSFDAITVGSLVLAATVGLRKQSPIFAESDLGLGWGRKTLGRSMANCAQAFQELAAVVPFFSLLAALQVISPGELVAVFLEIALAVILAGWIRNVRLAVIFIVAGAVLILTWRRNPFETLIVALLGLHLTVKACIAWNAVTLTHRFRANLHHELATPIHANDLAAIYRKRAWRENAAPLIGVALANAWLIVMLAMGARVPASLEQKFALCFALGSGVGLLFIDAAALFWSGLVRGVTTNNVHHSFSTLFGAIIGIPWAVAWAFSALHSGEAVTLNELAAYFIVWILLGGSISWITAAKARHKFERDLRTLISES